MQSCLKQLCATEGFNLEMLCVDIKRKPWIDLSKSKERDKLLQQIKQEKFDAIIVSPPCSIFSRAGPQNAVAASWAIYLPILLGRS